MTRARVCRRIGHGRGSAPRGAGRRGRRAAVGGLGIRRRGERPGGRSRSPLGQLGKGIEMVARPPERIADDIVQKKGRGASVRRKLAANKERNWLLALTLNTGIRQSRCSSA